jgi:hypothetical protein
MGMLVMVLGQSGSGKSSSMRNFESNEVGIFNVASKPLPFRKKLPLANGANYLDIEKSLKANKLHAYVVDDSTYLMQFENFAKAKIKGFDKFTDMAVQFEHLILAAQSTDPNTIVYFLHHPQVDDTGHERPKTIGKMLDNQLCVEGLFPIVIDCEVRDGAHVFVTSNDGQNLAKAPMEMFGQPTMDNDLKAVDTIIRDYYQMQPLSKPNNKKKENQHA